MSDQTSAPDPLAGAFDGFRGEALPLMGAPGVAGVRATVRRRRQVRAGAAVCALALVGGGAFALANRKPSEDRVTVANPSATASPSPEPAQTPSSAPSPTVSAPPPGAGSTDWRNATLTIPAAGQCHSAKVTFRNSKGASGRYVYLIRELAPVTGDVTRDGSPETLLSLSCGENGNYNQQVLMAFRPDGTPVGTIALPDPLDTFDAVSIRNGEIRVTLRQETVTQQRTYRWNGTKFIQSGGDTEWPNPDASLDASTYDWANATLNLPFTGSSVAVQPKNESCPSLAVSFVNGVVDRGACHYQLQTPAKGIGDVNGDGVKDQLVEISVKRSLRNSWLYVYTVKNGTPALIGFVTGGMLANADPNAAYDVELTGWSLTGRTISVQQFMPDGPKRVNVARTFTWDGSAFQPSVSPPPPSKVDHRP